jgi:hypothetical protein
MKAGDSLEDKTKGTAFTVMLRAVSQKDTVHAKG